jgi:hypothetical protein
MEAVFTMAPPPAGLHEFEFCLQAMEDRGEVHGDHTDPTSLRDKS